MINVQTSRLALEAMQGDVVAMSKSQVSELLNEVEIGNKARSALVNLTSIVRVAAIGAGAIA
jgi:hypothetical protein